MTYFQVNTRENERKNIIIVGAGIGGLCTGIRLQSAGFNVAIYEKNNLPGGCIRYVVSEDNQFKIEESASLAINPLTYDKIFNDVGKNPRDYFQWIPLENYYKVFTFNDKEFCLNTNLIKTQEHLKLFYPEDVEGYTKFIFDTAYKYLMAKENILNRAFINKSDIFNLKTLKTLGKLNVLNNAEAYVSKYVNSKELKQLILFQTFFMGVSPYKIPNIYTAVAANTQIESIAHIKGGLTAYVEGLIKLFMELGGQIKYNALIKSVVVNEKKAKGIIFEDKYICGDKIILNTDYIYGQSKLLNRKFGKFHIEKNQSKKNQLNIELSCSTFVVHLGLDKKYDSLEIHNIYLNENFKEEIEKVFHGEFPCTPSVYIYYPSVKDNDFCKNKDYSVMNVMVRVPNLIDLDISWDEVYEIKLVDICIDIIGKILKRKDLRSDLLFYKVTTPKDFENNYNYYKGSCFGIGHTFFQSMVFRPQIRDKKLKNLYYVGSSIHPGNGASIVMDCAELVSTGIIKEIKK